MEVRAVILVEGTSDRKAVETLARRRGRDLAAEEVAVVPMGGYGNLTRFLDRHGGARTAGVYDAGEEQHILARSAAATGTNWRRRASTPARATSRTN